MDIKETPSKKLTHNLRRPFGIGCKLQSNSYSSNYIMTFFNYIWYIWGKKCDRTRNFRNEDGTGTEMRHAFVSEIFYRDVPVSYWPGRYHLVNWLLRSCAGNWIKIPAPI